MKKSQIRTIAKEEGLKRNKEYCFDDEGLMDFAKRLIESEREACAAICAEYAEDSSSQLNFAQNCADSIIERYQK